MVRAPLLAVLIALVLPAAAAADFDVRAFSVTPSGIQAGSHPDVTISAAFTPYDAANPPEHVRDLRISLPPGLAGDPTSAERCTKAAFTADGCPAASRVGSTSVRTVIPLLVIGLPVNPTGDVYNLVPGAGEPARLGVVVRPPLGASKVFIESPVAIRQADGGLDSIITGMPSTVGLPVGESEMWIEAMSLTLEAPFASLPTSCKPAQASIAAVSGAGTASSRQADTFTPTGCDKVPFAPRLEATASSSRQPSLNTVITVPRGHASTATAAVTLPKGLTVNVNALRDACTLAEQAAGPCPARSRVGAAIARSPLLAEPLTGPVMLAMLPGQLLPGLRLDLAGAASLSLAGTVGGNPIRTEFAGIPDVPLERFELTFDAKRSLVTTTDLCRGPQPRLVAELTGHNGATARLAEPLAVTGCAKPAVTLTVEKRRLRLHVAALRGRPLQRVRLALPRGVRLRRTAVARADGTTLRRVRGRVVVVRPAAARHVTIAGMLNHRLRKRRAFVVETLDSTGRVVRQRLKRRG